MRTSQVVTFLESTSALALDRSPPWPGPGDSAGAPHRAAGSVLGAAARGQPPPAWPVPPDLQAELLAPWRAAPRPARGTGSAPRGDQDSWYQPVHYYGYDTGIFVREQSVVELAADLARIAAASSDAGTAAAETVGHLLREAFVVLYLHALFHHRVECLAVRMHVVDHRAHYVDYVEHAYRPAVGTDELLEESLADAFVYRMLSRRAHSTGVPKQVRQVTTAYLKDGLGSGRHTSPAAWDQGMGDLHSRVEQGSNRPTRRAIWRHLGPDLTGTFLDPSSDVYVVTDPATPAVVPRAEPAAPPCSPDQLVRILEHAGYTPGRRTRSPHVTLHAAGRPTAIVRTGEPLSPGVLAGNLDLVGATPADLPTLLAALRR